jgi:hypothetical protein
MVPRSSFEPIGTCDCSIEPLHQVTRTVGIRLYISGHVAIANAVDYFVAGSEGSITPFIVKQNPHLKTGN